MRKVSRAEEIVNNTNYRTASEDSNRLSFQIDPSGTMGSCDCEENFPQLGPQKETSAWHNRAAAFVSGFTPDESGNISSNDEQTALIPKGFHPQHVVKHMHRSKELASQGL